MKRERDFLGPDFVCPRDFFPPGVFLATNSPGKANTGEADRVGGLLFPDDHFVQKLLVGFRFEKFAHEPVHAFGGSLID